MANAEYLSWEADAHRVQEWAVLRIPDLLCTSDYTRALLCTDAVFRTQHLVGGILDHAGQRRLQDEIDSRRDRLDRVTGCQRDRPINEYTAIVEEAALRKVVGDSSIMRDQLLAGYSAREGRSTRVGRQVRGIRSSGSGRVDTE